MEETSSNKRSSKLLSPSSDKKSKVSRERAALQFMLEHISLAYDVNYANINKSPDSGSWTDAGQSSRETLVSTHVPDTTQATSKLEATSPSAVEDLSSRLKRKAEFFRECVLTERRLSLLGRRWLDRDHLQRLLSHCKPFVITVPRADSAAVSKTDMQFVRYDAQLVTIDHHDLFEYLLHDKHWKSFAKEISTAWPKTVGALVEEGEEEEYIYFSWQARALDLDPDTAFVCRKSLPRSANHQVALLDMLFRGHNVVIYPWDDMLWRVRLKLY